MKSTQQIHLWAARSCYKVPLSSVSLLELKLFTASDPQQFFRTAGRKTGRLLPICYNFFFFQTTHFLQLAFSREKLFWW